MGEGVMIANRFNPLGKSFLNTPAMQYVQDGLVLHLDGIENVGYGRHDAESKVWVDLVSGRKFANRANATDLISFENNYCHIKASNYSFLECPNCKDIQDVFETKNLTVTFVIAEGTNAFGGDLKIRNRTARFRGNATPNLYYMDCSYIPNNSISGAQCSESVISQATESGANVYGRKGDKTISYYKSTAIASIIYDDDTLRLGLGNYAYQSVAGLFYAVRFYNRALTAKELAHNYAIDKERFGL
jgi:hypothetical protein